MVLLYIHTITRWRLSGGRADGVNGSNGFVLPRFGVEK